MRKDRHYQHINSIFLFTLVDTVSFKLSNREITKGGKEICLSPDPFVNTFGRKRSVDKNNKEKEPKAHDLTSNDPVAFHAKICKIMLSRLRENKKALKIAKHQTKS